MRTSIAVAILSLLLPTAALGQAPPPPGSGEMPAATSFLDRHIDLDGYLRLRFDVMENLDLNHGPTPTTGQPIFPVPISGSDDTLSSANMRFRIDPTIRVGWGVSLHARFDILDNVVLGSTPEGLPTSVWAPMSGGSVSQVPPESGRNADVDSIRVKHAWGDVILPFGVLSAGRMGALMDWGTGFFINSGNCIDCDLGDVGDRVVFGMPLLGHLVSVAFDIGSSGPTSSAWRADAQDFDMDRQDDVRSWALLITNWETPQVVERYRRHGRTVFQYGLVASLRTQDYDIPAYYLTGSRTRRYDEKDMVKRGLIGGAFDLWLGLRKGGWTVDLEAAMVLSKIENASLLPGTEFLPTITARQFGGVARARYRWPKLELTMELGIASGDNAPGFGVRSPLNQFSSQPGDIDGPQIAIPGDTTVNNFRFNPDYHVDQILWRRIIGTVTDAFYARPSARYQLIKDLWLEGVLIASTVLESSSTPSGESGLGVELDLGLRYQLELGFEAQATYAVLFPLSGLRNVRLDLDPEPAQLFHLILAYKL